MSEPTYVPEEDITKKLKDGREVLVAAKGVPVPWARAVQLGLVKEPQQQGPRETKSEGEQVEGEEPPTGGLSVDPASPVPGTVETIDVPPGMGEQLPGSGLPPVVEEQPIAEEPRAPAAPRRTPKGG